MYEYQDYTRNYMPYQPSNLGTTNPMMNNFMPQNVAGANTYPDMMAPIVPMMPGMPNMQNIPGAPMMPPMQNLEMIQNDDLEKMYPDSYRMIYPMVKKSCDMIGERQITEGMLDDMAQKIYVNVETDNMSVEVKAENRKEAEKETRNPGGPFRPGNPFLNDFIKVLLLRELFERRHRRPGHRPPHYPMPRQYYNY